MKILCYFGKQRQVKHHETNIFFFLVLLIFLFLTSCNKQQSNSKTQTKVETTPTVLKNNKVIIGAEATVKVKEGGIYFVGRVDTGAKTTSIHVEKVKQIGDSVQYTAVNKDGKKFSMRSKIEDERYVYDADSKEKRFYVYLTLEFKGISKRTLVNLNDRSDSTYKILLGRNWLADSYLVDVSLGK